MRSCQHPHATESHCHAGYPLPPIPENGLLIAPSISVGVLKNDNPVALPQVVIGAVVGIREIFHNPEPTAIVEGHGNGLANLRFGSEHSGHETAGQGKFTHHFFCRHGAVWWCRRR
jgi:hypothetical protein